MNWRIESLDARHKRATFDCGNAVLNDFLRRYARQQQSRNLNRSYVAVRENDDHVAGFYTVSASSIGFAELDAALKLPRYPIPVMRIGRLAVDLEFQRQGLGEKLLADALRLSAAAAAKIGIYAVVIDAKHEKAANFYRRLGFLECREMPLTLYLPVATLLRGVS